MLGQVGGAHVTKRAVHQPRACATGGCGAQRCPPYLALLLVREQCDVWSRAREARLVVRVPILAIVTVGDAQRSLDHVKGAPALPMLAHHIIGSGSGHFRRRRIASHAELAQLVNGAVVVSVHGHQVHQRSVPATPNRRVSSHHQPDRRSGVGGAIGNRHELPPAAPRRPSPVARQRGDAAGCVSGNWQCVAAEPPSRHGSATRAARGWHDAGTRQRRGAHYCAVRRP
eukprot:scaffold28018_cov70-Phaeocystis_antarctica.AAC.4